MKEKKNNKLIYINIVGRESNLYFTSANRAGMRLKLQPNSVNWAIKHQNKLITENDEVCTIELVDGSEIPYKYINN